MNTPTVCTSFFVLQKSADLKLHKLKVKKTPHKRKLTVSYCSCARSRTGLLLNQKLPWEWCLLLTATFSIKLWAFWPLLSDSNAALSDCFLSAYIQSALANLSSAGCRGVFVLTSFLTYIKLRLSADADWEESSVGFNCSHYKHKQEIAQTIW